MLRPSGVWVDGPAQTGDGDEERLVAIFLHDNYARPNKQSGAWMSEFRMQTRNWNTLRFGGEEGGEEVTSARATADQIPIVINNNNFAKGAAGEPALLSFDDALTLFHEMGHGLHGMLSSVTYCEPKHAGAAQAQHTRTHARAWCRVRCSPACRVPPGLLSSSLGHERAARLRGAAVPTSGALARLD